MGNLSIVHCSHNVTANNQLEHHSFALLNVRSLVNKAFICIDLITSYNTDFFLLTQTLLSDGDSVNLIECSPPGYTFLNGPIITRHGDGLAVINK